MQVVDTEKSERGPQRRRATDGRLVHCCCVCGKVEPWGDAWTSYHCIKELDDESPIPKFCSAECKATGGARARNVTEAMKRKAKEAEWREPAVVYREQTEKEKYAQAAYNQHHRGRP